MDGSWGEGRAGQQRCEITHIFCAGELLIPQTSVCRFCEEVLTSPPFQIGPGEYFPLRMLGQIDSDKTRSAGNNHNNCEQSNS